MYVEFGNVYHEISQKYTRSTHYKFVGFINAPVSPMTIESNSLIRDFFYQLKTEYPEIDVKQSTYTYEAARRCCFSIKLNRIIDIIDEEKNDKSLEWKQDLGHYLHDLAYMHEIYKSMAQWSSKKIDNYESIAVKFTEFVSVEDIAALLQQYNKVQKAVSSFGEQLQILFHKVGGIPELPEELKSCFKSFTS